MDIEEKLNEGLLSDWLWKRNKKIRKSYEDTFNTYKEKKLEDLAELYLISQDIDSIQNGALKIMCGDDIGYKLRSLRKNLSHVPSYEIDKAKHLRRLIKTGGVIAKFEELCQGEYYDKYVAEGRSLTNFLGNYLEYERQQDNKRQEQTSEKEESIEPKLIPDNERTFKTFIAINTLLEKNGVTPDDLSAYFDRSNSFDQPSNKVTDIFVKVVNGFGYIPDDAYAFITGALMNLYEDDFRAAALSQKFFNYIRNIGAINKPLEKGSLLLHKYVIKFFIDDYAKDLPNKPDKYQTLWQTFLARTNGMTKVPVGYQPVDPDDPPATLLTVFNDIFNASFGLDPKVDKMLFNIKTYIAKYIELDV